MPIEKYDPEDYWDKVAQRITRRDKSLMIAGDTEPYYIYKRDKFLRIFNSIGFKAKRVLEIGPGPGGNLLEVFNHQPAELYGADISAEMIALSKKTIGEKNIRVIKINGKELPFTDKYFDIVYTVTVLQHITEEKILTSLIDNICRVAADDIYIFERIEKKLKVGESNIGRTIDIYNRYFSPGNFVLQEVRFLNLNISYFFCGAIRKIFNRKNRKEGEKASSLSELLQKIVLPVTKRLDSIIKAKRDMAMLHFKRIK